MSFKVEEAFNVFNVENQVCQTAAWLPRLVLALHITRQSRVLSDACMGLSSGSYN